MFGSKLKTWMENHIVRPKRKGQQEKEKVAVPAGKGPILESSESLAHSDTGISSGSQQVLSSSNTDNNEGYCTTTMESNRSGMAHCHTAVNLSSPESAYSTGYSTDGTSLGGAGPPEYYINIRTGKHYFPSPAPTPTSPQPSTAFASVNQCVATSFLTSAGAPASIPSYPSQLSSILSSETSASGTPAGGYGLVPFVRVKPVVDPATPARKAPPKSPLSTLKSFLKSPKQDKVKPKPEETLKKKPASPVKNKKWYKQPFQKFGHRRTDSTDGTPVKGEVVRREVQFDRSFYFPTKESTSSPRQRNRIRTNPWLPTEPLSSQNFHSLRINFSPNLPRNRSCTNTPLQNRRTSEADAEATPARTRDEGVACEEANGAEKTLGRHVGQKILLEVSDHSEEDLTLNEMMGTYNESYVYEKETDILSDSDPTDCEDYVSDSEADNGGDERDSHDDELDFIDTGSVVDGGDGYLKNTGKCTYHDVYGKKGHFLGKSGRHHPGESRKSFKKDGDAKRRRSKEEKRRRSFRRPPPQRQPEVRVINMSKLIMERANAGKNGSKSADGTPICLRRRKMMKELRETHIGDRDRVRERGAAGGSPSAGKAVLEDDLETDRRYNELILEAENIIVTMRNSPIARERRKLDAERDSLSVWRDAEAMCAAKVPEPKTTPRRNLGLSLAVDPKTSRNPLQGKNSFRARSSAHSPLDPLGPTFKNFTVFKEEKKISSSSSEESGTSKPGTFERKTDGAGKPQATVVPIAFQSVDLGKPITSYCPQSEPVKRKIYSCSKTYDKLVRRFENETKIVQEERGRNPPGTRKRSDSYRSVQQPEGPPPQGARSPARRTRSGDHAPPGNFFFNPVYSPYSSPAAVRRGPGGAPSPGQCRRLSYDVEEIR